MKAFALVALLFAALAGARPVESSLTHEAIVANSAKGLRLLRLGPSDAPQWFTEEAKLDLMRKDVKFMDVTETWEDIVTLQAQRNNNVEATERMAVPQLSKAPALSTILPNISITRMNATLTALSNYNNRYYTSTTGVQASTYIRDQIQAMITAAGRTDITVSLYSHSWAQPSIIAKVAGAVNNTAPITILGAHMDSINLSSPSSGRAPGADDDGSGTVNVIEIVKVLIDAGWQPATPVEFHWYAAEEVGLLGSNAVAVAYARAGKKLKGFMELDMTAYFKPGTAEVIAIESDYVTSSLVTFTKNLVSSYSSLPAANDPPCGYACSDHASWYGQGYPTVMLYEAITGNDNPRIHGSTDTITGTGFSWSHSVQFARVALAFVYELSATV